MAERGLLRWVGSKRQHVDRIVPMIDAHRGATGGRLISLFFGSGAIERAAGGCYAAADASPELLQLYADLQKHGGAVVHAALLDYAKGREFTPESYRKAREVTLEARAELTSSARFLWLCSLAFNGIWRVNAHGEMNMPPDPARLAQRLAALPPLAAFEAFADQIRGIRFVCGWENALAMARPGDVVVADPPYGEFDGYCAGGFGSRDHRVLASALKCHALASVGVIAFNAPEAAPIYHWAKVEERTRSGCVSSKATKRDPVAEIIITQGLRGQP